MPAARSFVWAFGALVAAACGPSVGTIYEGNIRFEHCYRLDMDPKIAETHRAACWREWTDRYTYGQTRDRLEYARRRIAAIDAGEAGHPSLHVESTDGGTPQPLSQAPMPTSLNAPPPPTLPTAAPPGPTDAGADAREGSPPEPPGADCAADCRDTWQSCRSDCEPDAGPKQPRCKGCDADYRRCVQRCLR